MELTLLIINRAIIERLNKAASVKGYDNFEFNCYMRNLMVIYATDEFKEVNSNTIRKCKISERNIANKNYKFTATPHPIKIITDLYEEGYYSIDEKHCFLVLDECTEECLRGLDLQKQLYEYPIFFKTRIEEIKKEENK